MESLIYFFICLLFFCVISMLTKGIIYWFERNGWRTENYQGVPVLQGFGLSIVLHYIVYHILLLSFYYTFEYLYFFLQGAEQLPKLVKGLAFGVLAYDLELREALFTPYLFVQKEVVLFFLILSVLGLVGWMDDHFGEKTIKGFKGHFLALFREYKITSGMMKAIYGLVISLLCTFFYQEGLLDWLISSSLLLFSIHFFNLLDVRPGRAIKGFWLFLLLIVPFIQVHSLLFFIAPVVLSTLVLFQYDRRRIVMLGDTGSNIIGGLYGFLLVIHVPIFLQYVYVVLFVLLAVLAEKYSFTAVIQKNPLLSKVDNWGIR